MMFAIPLGAGLVLAHLTTWHIDHRRYGDAAKTAIYSLYMLALTILVSAEEMWSR